MFSVFPLDMVQYKRLFYSTRIPKKDKDELVSFPSSRHILVLRNQHMYLVPVQEPNGKGGWVRSCLDMEELGDARCLLVLLPQACL